jgi:hypothetical protein
MHPSIHSVANIAFSKKGLILVLVEVQNKDVGFY